MSALSFREQMSGYVAFGDRSHVDGYREGRRQGTRLRLQLRIVVDDVDRFIAGPQRTAVLRGTVRFDELGGTFEIERGEARLLPGGPGGRGRMHYCVGVRSDAGVPLTVRGVKRLEQGAGPESWTDITSLRTRVLHGEPVLDRTEDDVDDDEREQTLATGIVRITLPGVVAGLASFRPKARGRLAGGVAVARFWAAFAGSVADLYLPRAFEPEPREQAPATVTRTPLHVVDAKRSPKLQLARHPFAAARENGDDMATMTLVEEAAGPPELNLEHITSPDIEPSQGPVLLIAGSSVAAQIFLPVGVRDTIVHRLVAEGYDGWAENWRASLGQPPRAYTLDEAAALDHPQAVAHILEHTGRTEMKALVHCLGSSSFMLGLASGRMPEITHVVSNAVSLHPVVPRRAEIKIRSLASVLDRVMPWWDPQWGRQQGMDDRSGQGVPTPAERNLLSSLLVNWVRMTHNECTSDVCNFGNFMYGDGRRTLYDERDLRPETREWMENQLSWAPMRLYRQIARSLVAGHLVPMREWPDDVLRGDLFETGPSESNTQITFIAGAENRCFSPRSQQRTYEWFASHQPGQHRLAVLPGFGHLDVWLRPDAAPVFDKVIAGLRG